MEIGNLLSDEVVADVEWEDGAVIRVKYVPRDKMLDFIHKATVVRWNGKHQKEEDVDANKLNLLVGREAVVGWSGITQNKEDVPFAPETRDLFMQKWGDFCTFVSNVCTDLQALVDSERDEAEKKSSPSSEHEGTSRS